MEQTNKQRRGSRLKERIFLGIVFLSIATIPTLLHLSFRNQTKETKIESFESSIQRSKAILADSIKHDWVNDSTVSIQRRRVYDYLINEK